MAASRRVPLFIKNPPLDEGSRCQGNLQVIDGLALFQAKIAVKWGVTVVINAKAIPSRWQ
jgi:hypothetical protein